MKPVPRIVTREPPAVDPAVGEILERVAADVKVYEPLMAETPEVWPFVDKDKTTVEGRKGGDVHLTVVEEM
jgi:hypothetical protein